MAFRALIFNDLQRGFILNPFRSLDIYGKAEYAKLSCKSEVLCVTL